jgi:hypothetical protein
LRLKKEEEIRRLEELEELKRKEKLRAEQEEKRRREQAEYDMVRLISTKMHIVSPCSTAERVVRG